MCFPTGEGCGEFLGVAGFGDVAVESWREDFRKSVGIRCENREAGCEGFETGIREGVVEGGQDKDIGGGKERAEVADGTQEARVGFRVAWRAAPSGHKEEVFSGESFDGLPRGDEAFALPPAADKQRAESHLRNVEALPRFLAIEDGDGRADAIGDDADSLGGDIKVFCDFRGDHLRIGDDVSRALEDPPFEEKQRAVLGLPTAEECPPGRLEAGSTAQPCGMNPIPGTVNIAARRPLQTQGHIKLIARLEKRGSENGRGPARQSDDFSKRPGGIRPMARSDQDRLVPGPGQPLRQTQQIRLGTTRGREPPADQPDPHRPALPWSAKAKTLMVTLCAKRSTSTSLLCCGLASIPDEGDSRRVRIFLIAFLVGVLPLGAEEGRKTLVFPPGASEPVATPTPAAEARTAEPAELIDLFFRAMQSGKVEEAYDGLTHGTIIAERTEDVAALKKKTQDAVDHYGPIQGYEVVDDHAVGKSLLRRTCLSLNTDLPLRWRFYFYKSGGVWRLVDLRVDDGLVELFEDAVRRKP